MSTDAFGPWPACRSCGEWLRHDASCRCGAVFDIGHPHVHPGYVLWNVEQSERARSNWARAVTREKVL